MNTSRHMGTAGLAARQAWLQRTLAGPVSLVWTDNRAAMVSVKRRSVSGYDLRLHHMFRQAPEAVWQALVAYIQRPDGAASQTLRAYIKQQQHLIRKQQQHLIRGSHARRPGSQPLQTQGRHFNLAAIYDDLNQTYFASGVQADITWMRRPPTRPRTSIRFGSYDDRQRLIRIHPVLDQAFVPRYVVERVVFHEMLHQLMPRQRINGRWSIHPPAFRQAEQRFQHYHQAERWQQEHLPRLLRAAAP